MGVTKVTRNYQITLPCDVREIADIKKGDRLIATNIDNGIVLKKIDKKGIAESTFGAWKSKGSGVEYVREIRKGWSKRAKRIGLE